MIANVETLRIRYASILFELDRVRALCSHRSVFLIEELHFGSSETHLASVCCGHSSFSARACDFGLDGLPVSACEVAVFADGGAGVADLV